MSEQIVKPKTQRGKRALDRRDPKIFENIKTCMLLKGGNTSQMVTQCLTELYMLKKPHAVLFKKKNVTRPFEDESSLEFFSSRADASLFVFGSHSKKRPNNLILGRMFDGHILDMVEFGIQKFVSMVDIKGPKWASGVKPALVFNGDRFNTDAEYIRLKNLLIDLFRGPVVDNVRLAGVEHVISFTAVDGKVFFRNYKVTQKKREVDLTSVGPSLNLVVRRTKLASDDHFKLATKQPKTAKPKKKKNVSHDAFGSKLGRIHMTSQDLQKLPDRRMKRLQHKKPAEAEEEDPPAKKEDPPAKKQRTD